jgi:hypothetical protein
MSGHDQLIAAIELYLSKAKEQLEAMQEPGSGATLDEFKAKNSTIRWLIKLLYNSRCDAYRPQ